MELAAKVSAVVVGVTLVMAIIGILIDRYAFGRGRGEGRER
jgi:F0F1-type ATP synthase assembly protein I